MIDLNNLEEIKKLDPKDVYGSTEKFIDQCTQIHSQIESTHFSLDTSDINSFNCFVFSGMGGSAYGGRVAQSLFRDEMKLPMYVNSDYSLPFFVDCDSIILATSYSGNTEETLTSFDEAKTRNAYKVGLTSGGKLADYFEGDDGDLVQFNPKNNPSGQPRLGTGYVVLGTIEILRRLRFIDLTSQHIEEAIAEAADAVDTVKKNAKDFAQKIKDSIPMIFAGDFIEGNAHILRNQFNETAKTFSSYHIVPEANHHVMEGLKNPSERRLISLFLTSSLYNNKLKKRMSFTQDVIKKNDIETLEYKAIGKTKLSQILELLMFGGYLTFYLAILYEQDPSLIPWVDYFKEKMKE